MDRFSQACKDFGLTISLKKTSILGRIQWNCQTSPSMTLSSMSLNSSYAFALPSQTTSPWTLRSIRGLRRQPQHLLASFHEYEPQTDSEDQDGRVQCLCRQLTDIRQRDVDHICQTGKKTQFLPPEKHPPYPCNILPRQSVQRRGPVPNRPSKHVHPAQTA